MEGRVAARVRKQRWYLRFPRAMPVALFLLVSAITALSVFAIERVESERAEAQHHQMALAVSSSIERLASANSAYLRAGAAMIGAQGALTQRTFREFAMRLSDDDALKAGVAMAWAEEIPRRDIAAFERAMQASVPDFRVHPATRNAVALPVVYIASNSPVSPGAYGFDFHSEPVRMEAVRKAMVSGRPTASASLELVVRGTHPTASGFGMFMPVFAANGGQKLRGVLARSFNAQGFVEAAVSTKQLQGYGLALFDGSGASRKHVASIGRADGSSRPVVRTISIADHDMYLAIYPPDKATLSNLSLLTLLFGIMVAALLLVVARLVTQQAAEDRAALAWFEEQASIRNSLTRELNHRVKNTLANVLSIVALTRRRTDNIDDFVTGLLGRVRALSATHDLLTQSEWGSTPIRAVMVAELAPYVQDADRAVAMRGPDVELAPNDALSLGLAVHELATNASKYGALSISGGRVSITWEMLTDKVARIEWLESGGPAVAETRRRGFGTELIEKIVAHELKNPVELQFAPGGVRCVLIVPVRTPAAFLLRERPAGA